MTNPWDRIVNGGGNSSESRKAYLAFCVYRDLGPERTELRAYELAKGRTGGKNASGRWQVWAVKWRWVERADLWDVHREQLRREAEDKAMQAHFEALATKRLALMDTETDLVDRLLAQARQMLEWPIAERTINNEDGVTIIKPARWSKGDAAKFIELADKLQRLSLGLETDRHAVQIEGAVQKAVQEMAEEKGISYEEMLAEVDAVLHPK